MATFDLSTTRHLYNPTEAKELEELGFQLTRTGLDLPNGKNAFRLPFDHPKVEVEINSLEQLEEFGRKYGRLIVDFEDGYIEIFNDYR